MKNKLHSNSLWLYTQYWTKGLNITQIGRMCGITASGIWYWIEKLNIPRKSRRKENHYNWRGGSKMYYCRQARLAWEEYWGEEVPKGYLIHHIDRDRTNNDVCNLALVTSKFHRRVHHGGMTWKVINGKRVWLDAC